MSDIRNYNPPALAKPLGDYTHVSRVKANEFLHIAGQVSVDASGQLVGKSDFTAQMRQVFANLRAALASAGADFSNVVKFTTFLVHAQDIETFMAVRRHIFPSLFPSGTYPPNTLLIVDRLVQEQFLIEVEAVAAL
jgi:enamine deaminase RidA (YjgF/YER057c/UK114 family)